MEDLLVQVDKFKVPMDFVVLEMKEALLRNKKHMRLVGRPFMATTKTLIDVQSGRLIMTVLGETIQFKAAHLVPYPFATSRNQCSYVDFIDSFVIDLSF